MYLIEQGHCTALASVSVYFSSSFYYCCWDSNDFQRIYKSNYFHHQFLKSPLFWNIPSRWVCCLKANMLNKSIFRNVKDGWNKKIHILCIQIYVHILYHLQGFPLQSDQRLLNNATQVPRELSAVFERWYCKPWQKSRTRYKENKNVATKITSLKCKM